jgi:KipI family sensor histidine kinase inhibitor
MNVVPYGDRAVLLDVADRSDAPAVLERVRVAMAGRDGVLEVIGGARTVLVEVDRATDLTATGEAMLSAANDADGATAIAINGEIVEIPVDYSGADVGAVAALIGASIDELVRLHTAPLYAVAFCGFSPGFAYLTGLDARLQLPRLPRPRTAVPAGSVGIAGEYTGVYPRSSPGGWRLLGHTDVSIWDLDRTPPALLAPGARVRLVAT